MTKKRHSLSVFCVALATVWATTMVPAHAQQKRNAKAPAPVIGPVPAYRFATVIKTQSLRHPMLISSTGAVAEARIDTQLIHSPAYPDLRTCRTARASVSQLLGEDVSISAGSSAQSTQSTATVKYSSSECLPSLGP